MASAVQARGVARPAPRNGRAQGRARCLRFRPQAAPQGHLKQSDQPPPQPQRQPQAQPPPQAHTPPRAVVETGLLGERRTTVPLASGDGGVTESQTTAAAALDADSRANASSGAPMASLRAFFLPAGWPGSVTPDYLQYQVATIPAHITGWVSHSLATSSMIAALGIGAGPTEVAAVSAAVKWITKDGLGAAGRLIVGGRLSSVFDEDPKRWRMVAEAVSTVGLALEIATQIFPANFVLLAGVGTLCKSTAKGMGRPCFRIIQTHFSANNNVGDVAAKEEVWEVAAQLAGLAVSVAALQLLEASGVPDAIVPVWMVAHGTHVYLRYIALSALRFPYPNQKRAAFLASSYVRTGGVPSVEAGNVAEQVLLPPTMCSPRVVYGCTLHQALNQTPASTSSGNGSGSGRGSKGEQLAELLRLYDGERYLLTWHSGTAWVLVLEGAQRMDLLRAMLQAAWLELQHSEAQAGALPVAGGGDSDGSRQLLADSLAAVQQQWPGFVLQAEQSGWQLANAVLPPGTARLRVE